MSDTDRPETQRVAFCQNCGKPLSADEARTVGSSVFCEPCLVAKVAAAEAAGANAGSADRGPNAGGSYGFRGTSSGVNYEFRGTMPPSPPPPVPGEPNPGLAALLGFIPGVGAFYNGQYAKGVVHLVVFAILTTLADRNGIFGLFVAGWIFYQVIEAHHTARARRDGTPLPNPFGLNDIGERLGFGKAWPGASHPGTPPPYGPPVGTPAPPTAGAETGSSYVPPPAAAYAPPEAGYGNYAPPPPPSWGYGSQAYGAVPPEMPPNVPFSPFSRVGSRVPTGAILLIGLGVIFLIGNIGFLHGFPVHRLIPFLLIGVGVWLFIRKMTDMGGTLADDGSAGYRRRLFCAARGPIWIVLVGLLFLLDSFNILSWGRSWPLFIIVGGLMTFFERTAYASLPPSYPYAPPVAPAYAEPVTPPGPGTSVVPPSTDSREGN